MLLDRNAAKNFVCSFATIVKFGELQRSFVIDPVGLYSIAG
ncbi:hypothetical protein SLEP1_g41109 [Rubroshorea leprosula]|uniref:Uncharacterized protein n=1 Tax=Rubroshorea leprosula TaxID=152421 RepID=A0AAV5L5N4_9ROSI|nr:hypothetical protein SLEP1_g41109 [Rubroshorea leprosula]